MNGHSIFQVAGITTRKGHHHRDVPCLCYAEHKFVPLFQAIDSQTKPAQLVFFVGVGAGYVAQQVGIELAQAGAKSVVESGQIIVVPNAVG